METLWMIPVHVRPVVSLEGMRKNEIMDPSSGLDRFNLTDVGEAVFGEFRDNGAEVIAKGVEPPFPWELVFKIDKDPKASLRGMKVGPSTYRSIFKLMFFDSEDVIRIIRGSMERIGRDLLESPYWDDDTWQMFQNQYRLSRNVVVGSNIKILERI